MSVRNNLLEQILSATTGGFDPTTNLNIERLLDGISTTSPQEPTGTGTANSKQIDFGPAVNDGTDPVMLAVDGTLTINETGTYRIKVALQFGRAGASGTSVLLFRVVVNGVQAGQSVATKLENANEEQYYDNDTWIFLPAGTELNFEVMRDAGGDDSGGLFGVDPTVEGGNEWNSAPSAAIRVERWM